MILRLIQINQAVCRPPCRPMPATVAAGMPWAARGRNSDRGSNSHATLARSLRPDGRAPGACCGPASRLRNRQTPNGLQPPRRSGDAICACNKCAAAPGPQQNGPYWLAIRAVLRGRTGRLASQYGRFWKMPAATPGLCRQAMAAQTSTADWQRALSAEPKPQ